MFKYLLKAINPGVVKKNNRTGTARRAPAVRLPRAQGKRQLFDMAVSDRLTASWSINTQSIDQVLRHALVPMRARSRQLAINNDYVKLFITLLKTNVIGHQGIRLQNRASNPDGSQDKAGNRQIESTWKAWGRPGSCDVTGRLSWTDAQRLFIVSAARDGEVLIRIVRDFDNRHHFALQFLEPDLLDETYNTKLANGNEVRLGVEYDQWQRPVAYHLLTSRFSAGSGAGASRRRLPAGEIIHAFLPDEWIRLSRGLPWLHSSAMRLHMLGGIEEAELVASRLAASKMGFYKRTEGSEDYKGDGEDEQGAPISDAEPGHFEKLPDGWDFINWDPDHPAGNFEPFMKSMLRGATAGMGVSYHRGANDVSDVSYSSGRLAELSDRDVWRLLQNWVAEHFCQPVFTPWLETQLLHNSLAGLPLAKIDKFDAATWRGRGWTWVDPLKEQKGAEIGRKTLNDTLTDQLAERGIDLEEHLETLKRERELAAEYGLDLDQALNANKTGGTTTAPPTD